MDDEELVFGDWYMSPQSKAQLFRYEGRNVDAYVFSKFNSRDPKNPGELVTTIEIYNLDALEPWEPEPQG